jgi:hypothetical protein
MIIHEMIDPKAEGFGEDTMIGKERREETQPSGCGRDGVSDRAAARAGRKTVRSWLKKGTWPPYRQEARGEHVLEAHRAFCASARPFRQAVGTLQRPHLGIIG